MEINVLRRLENTASRLPDKAAYSDTDSSLSFFEVLDKARRVGSALCGKVSARQPVAVMSGRNVYTPVVFLGIVYAGCFYAPMDATMPKARLNQIIGVIKADYMIVDKEHLEIAKGLDFDGQVTSPTFALINEYRGGRLPLFHFDMYRISNWEELYTTGFFEYREEGGVIAVEWSENIEAALPEETIVVSFFRIDDMTRKITIDYPEGEKTA